MTNLPENLVSQLTSNTDWLDLPPVAQQIVDLGGNSTNNLGAVANAIGSNDSMAEAILRIANSDFYARRRKSSNLRQTMIVLGLTATFTLALGIATFDTANRFTTAKDLASAADEALYHSQRSGRNCSTNYANIRVA